MKSHAIFRPGKTLGSRRSAELRHTRRVTNRAPAQPFVADYLPALLAQVHALIAGQFHRVAAEHGLAPSEWRVLATLASGEPMSIGQLATITVMKQPTVTRLLDRMERTGHVRRVPHGEDRRITLVTITPDGQKVADRLVGLAREHEQQVLQPFGATRAAELKKMLRSMIALHEALDAAGTAED